jgi:hypothetical protein
MTTAKEEILSVQLGQLRAILARLAFVRDGKQQEELMEQARLAIVGVRKTRAAVAARDGLASAASNGQGLVVDYADGRTRTASPGSTSSH